MDRCVHRFPFFTMEYDPILLASWVAAVTRHADLVRNNAPIAEQKRAENVLKTGLVRLLVSVGVDFDQAMTAAGLSDEDYVEDD
jgi:hypothetical protein